MQETDGKIASMSVFALTATLTLLVCLFGFWGCAQKDAGDSSEQPDKNAGYTNSVTAGKLSMEYPDGFSVAREYESGQYTGNFPDGVTDTASKVLLDESGTAMLTVVDADDASGVGLEGLSAWIEATPERLQKMKETQPEMYESLKDVERESLRELTINGEKALRVVMKTDSITTATYYLEKNGLIAGYVSMTLPSSEYEKNEASYEDIAMTTRVS